MGEMVQRVFLTGLALGPAAALVAFPLPGVGLPAAIGLAAAGSICALFAAVKHRPAATRNTTPLLRRQATKRMPLPPLQDRRRAVADALFPPTPEAFDAPPGKPEAIAAALSRVLAAWDSPPHDALSVEETTELYLLAELLKAPADRAGELAQLFQRPDIVLDMRDTVLRLARKRAIFDRQRAAFDATATAWQGGHQTAGQAEPPGIRELAAPDPDLWHRVVAEHDRTDPEQRSAALWCVRQTTCDRATVALYLACLAADGGLQAAALRGDTAFLDSVLGVIQAWNAGDYQVQELALDPPDSVAHDGARFAQALAELAILTESGRWPEPCGAFTEYHGRAPRSRAHWCLRSGRLIQAPDPADYGFRAEHRAA